MKAQLLVAGVALALSGCALESTLEHDHFDDEGGDTEDHHGEVDYEEPLWDELEDGTATVQSQMRRCTTAGVVGLTEQIIAEMQCLAPGSLERLDSHPKISITGSAVLPYFAPETLATLRTAASRSTRTMQLNSAFRSVVQQHMIYTWRSQRRCKIRFAARPGRSRHESGRAVDILNYSSLVSPMRNAGWVRNVPRDYIHFEYLPAPDLGSLGILAFQRLWNRNHPNDLLDEDGDYGPATARAINRAPAGGFRIGANCRAMQ